MTTVGLNNARRARQVLANLVLHDAETSLSDSLRGEVGHVGLE